MRGDAILLAPNFRFRFFFFFVKVITYLWLMPREVKGRGRGTGWAWRQGSFLTGANECRLARVQGSEGVSLSEGERESNGRVTVERGVERL